MFYFLIWSSTIVLFFLFYKFETRNGNWFLTIQIGCQIRVKFHSFLESSFHSKRWLHWVIDTGIIFLYIILEDWKDIISIFNSSPPRVNRNKLVILKKEYTKLTSLTGVKFWLESDCNSHLSFNLKSLISIKKGSYCKNFHWNIIIFFLWESYLLYFCTYNVSIIFLIPLIWCILIAWSNICFWRITPSWTSYRVWVIHCCCWAPYSP